RLSIAERQRAADAGASPLVARRAERKRGSLLAISASLQSQPGQSLIAPPRRRRSWLASPLGQLINELAEAHKTSPSNREGLAEGVYCVAIQGGSRTYRRSFFCWAS